MSIDSQFLEALLHEEEGTTIDFKREAYRFEGAKDEEKSELLKDILAFANSWRRTDAYILIGVEEVKGGRSKPLGVVDHIDDAKLQQFINSKTNKPVQISVHTVTIDNLKIDVIKIPLQERPIYLSKQYGKIQAEDVLIRRGSSTAKASPTEIAQMGSPITASERSAPNLVVTLYDKNIDLRSDVQKIKCIQLVFIGKIPDYEDSSNDFATNLRAYLSATHGRNYWRKYFKFFYERYLLHPLYVSLENTGYSTAREIHVDLKISADAKTVDVRSEDDLTDQPSDEFPSFVVTRTSPILNRPIADVRIFKSPTKLIETKLDFLQPKRTWISKNYFFIGACELGPLNIEAVAYATGLSEPIVSQLKIDVEHEKKYIDLSGLRAEIKRLYPSSKN